MYGIIVRWAFALALVVATYNPTQWNYAIWVQKNYQNETSLAVLLGLLLGVGYIIYVRATLRSFGFVGMALVAAIMGALIWVLYDWGILDLGRDDLRIWLALGVLSAVLGFGLSWSIVRRALSGQVDTDEVEE